MLDQKEWLSQAQALHEGGKAQIAHSCGSGRKLLIEHKPDGFAAWCYRCSEPGWAPKPRPSLSERIAALSREREQDARLVADIRPPMPAEFNPKEWPDEAKVWLYKAGIDNDWIEELGFYYNEASRRVVMPVLDDRGTLKFWQARGFDPRRPKYLSPALGQDSKPLYKAGAGSGETLVLTEDILSAVRVGQVASGWSLLGTSLNAGQEREVVDFKPERVLVWLDPDAAGVKARRKLVPRLRALGLNAKAVRSNKDPKDFNIDEIKGYLA